MSIKHLPTSIQEASQKQASFESMQQEITDLKSKNEVLKGCVIKIAVNAPPELRASLEADLEEVLCAKLT